MRKLRKNYKDLLLDYTFNKQDFILEVLKRLEEVFNEEDIFEAIDCELTYEEERWTLLQCYFNVKELTNNSFYETQEYLYNDIYSLTEEVEE